MRTRRTNLGLAGVVLAGSVLFGVSGCAYSQRGNHDNGTSEQQTAAALTVLGAGMSSFAGQSGLTASQVRSANITSDLAHGLAYQQAAVGAAKAGRSEITINVTGASGERQGVGEEGKKHESEYSLWFCNNTSDLNGDGIITKEEQGIKELFSYSEPILATISIYFTGKTEPIINNATRGVIYTIKDKSGRILDIHNDPNYNVQVFNRFPMDFHKTIDSSDVEEYTFEVNLNNHTLS